MATFVRIITEDSVLERIAGATPGLLHRVRAIEATLQRQIASAFTVEDRDNAEREHIESLLELGHGAIAVGRLALWEGLRSFNAFSLAEVRHLDRANGIAMDRALMVDVIEAQADRLYPDVPGVSPTLIARENDEHRARCGRAIDAVNAGVIDALAWSDEPLTAIQQRIEQNCDIISLP